MILSLKSSLRMAALAASLALYGGPVYAQKAEEIKKLQNDMASLKSDIQALAAKQQQMLDQLGEIKKLLAKSNAGANPEALQLPETINVEKNPVLGKAEARVGIIELTDFQCPFCGRFTSEAYPRIVSDYVDTGKVRFIYLDMPLASIHPWAQLAAVAAHCAGEQGKFWEMHNSLFADQRAMRPPDISDRAAKLGLDTSKFNECINSSRYNELIDTNVKSAQRMNINGTPTFLLGTFRDGGSVMKIEKSIVGTYPFEKFQADLDELLKK